MTGFVLMGVSFALVFVALGGYSTFSISSLGLVGKWERVLSPTVTPTFTPVVCPTYTPVRTPSTTPFFASGSSVVRTAIYNKDWCHVAVLAPYVSSDSCRVYSSVLEFFSDGYYVGVGGMYLSGGQYSVVGDGRFRTVAANGMVTLYRYSFEGSFLVITSDETKCVLKYRKVG